MWDTGASDGTVGLREKKTEKEKKKKENRHLAHLIINSSIVFGSGEGI